MFGDRPSGPWFGATLKLSRPFRVCLVAESEREPQIFPFRQGRRTGPKRQPNPVPAGVCVVAEPKREPQIFPFREGPEGRAQTSAQPGRTGYQSGNDLSAVGAAHIHRGSSGRIVERINSALLLSPLCPPRHPWPPPTAVYSVSPWRLKKRFTLRLSVAR
jgi:hypothetical protein